MRESEQELAALKGLAIEQQHDAAKPLQLQVCTAADIISYT